MTSVLNTNTGPQASPSGWSIIREKGAALLHSPALCTLGGTVGGIFLGAISNFAKTSSFLSRSLGDCSSFKQLAIVGPLNQWREKHFHGGLLHIFPPLMTIPASLLAIGNALKKEGDTPRTWLSVIGKMGTNFHKLIVSPTFYNISGYLLCMNARPLLQKLVNPLFPIDISGHAAFHFLYLTQVYSSLAALSEVGGPFQSAIAKFPVIASSLLDALWLYNTTANCHSIADIGIGLAMGFGSYALLKKGIVPLVSWSAQDLLTRFKGSSPSDKKDL